MKKMILCVLIFVIHSNAFPQSWQKMNTNFYGTFRDLYFTNNDTGYVVCEGGDPEILKTEDGGITWVPHQSNSWSGLHSVCFVNQDTGYAVGGGGGGIAVVRKTYDAGINWDINYPLNGGLSNWPALFSVHFPTSILGYAVGMSATGKGIILKTTDAGQSWDSLNVIFDYALWSVFFVNPSVGFAAGINGSIIKTTDSGASWISQNVPVSEHLRSILFVDSLIGFAVGDNGTIIKTENSGDIWETISIQQNNDLATVHFINDSVGYIGGDNGFILKTMNCGNSWYILNSNFNNRIESIQFPSVNKGYLVGHNDLIAESNFEPVLLDTIPDVEFNEDSGQHILVENLYDIFYDVDTPVLTFNPIVLHTGISIEVIDSSLYLSTVQDSFGLFTISIECMDDYPNSVLDTFNVLINSINDPPIIDNFPDTLTFHNDSSLTINIWEFVNDVESNDSLLFYEFSFSDSSIIWSYTGSTGELAIASIPNYIGTSFMYILVQDDSNATALDTSIINVIDPTYVAGHYNNPINDFHLMQNYPNPFNPETTIEFELPRATVVTISIYNITGEKILILLKEFRRAGRHSMVWKGENRYGSKVPSGVYFYRFEAGEFKAVKKMVLIR